VEGSCYNYDWAVNGSVYNFNDYGRGNYGFRNCTDYVAWKIRSQGGNLPSGLGNAKEWVDTAASWRVTNSPSEGYAAVSTSGTYGHVMYVEQVLDNGSIIVSDYNRAGTGKYDISTMQNVGGNS